VTADRRRCWVIHFPRRRSPGILYGIRVPTELPISPDQDECVRDEAHNADGHTLEHVDVALNPHVTTQITL